MARDAVLAASLALIGFLAFLTVRVLVSDGFTVLVALSLGILVLVAVGVVGALTQPPRR